MDIFSVFFNIREYCVFTLESPHRGDSNECTLYIIFNIKKNTLNYLRSAAMPGFFQGTQERVRNNRGKRAFSSSHVYGVASPLFHTLTAGEGDLKSTCVS